MDKFSKPEQTNWAAADTKRALLRVAAFLLIFLTAHWLLLWLRPMGAHRFFWNLALSALASWLLVRLLLPSLDTKHSEADRHPT
jgi:hypothetical protein